MIPVYATLLESSDLFTVTENKLGQILKRKMNAEDVAFTSDGRNAIYLALKDAGLKRGDEVIIPGYTCWAVSDAVKSVCRPVFADIDPRTFNISVPEIKKHLSKRTKALIAVHSYGNPCDIEALKEIAERENLILIEDCAQSLLGTYKGKSLGSFGDYAILSFRFSKDITCFRGGALLSKTPIKGKPSARPAVDLTGARVGSLLAGETALKILPGFLHHALVGMVSREEFRECDQTLTDYQLSILQRQFLRLPEAIEKRRRNARLYIKGFSDIIGKKISIQKEIKGHTYYRFTLRAEQAKPLQEFMLGRGIQADRMYSYSISKEKESANLAEEVLNLPTHHNLKRRDMERIMEVLHEFF